MSLSDLNGLITDAVITAGGDRCGSQHRWEMEGGRPCPKELGGCSQTVYRCSVCGVYDYGEPGGPAAAECDECDRPTYSEDPDGY